MPFIDGGSRNEAQLTAFFENNIKRPIESADLRDRYEVYRSGQSFDINAEIIRDLCRADIVVADLSGVDPNPNVMYELGVRLATSVRPVILIREQQTDNRRIFDIYGFYTHPYDPYDYRPLEGHLIEKLRRWEAGDEPYTNPVLNIIRAELATSAPDLSDVAPAQQQELALHGVRAVATAIRRAYGPDGVGLGVDSRGGGVRLERRGIEIARAIRSANPFEEAGIRLMAGAAAQLVEKGGDGSKLPVIVSHALIEEALAAIGRGAARSELLNGISKAIAAAVDYLRQSSVDGADCGRAVVDTASHGRLEIDVWAAFTSAGPNGIVLVEESRGASSSVTRVDHMTLDRGALHPELVTCYPRHECVLDGCAILLYASKVTSMQELLPLLEVVARRGQPLLIVADDVAGEALATLIVNVKKGTLLCVAVRAPRSEGRRREILQDLAILTGATLLDPEAGANLGTAASQHLGSADKVIVGRDQTEIVGGRGDHRALQEHVDVLRATAKSASPYDAALLRARIANLVGSVVTIHLGATTPQEMHVKRYRTESSLHAAAAAVIAGGVPGGGRTLQMASHALKQLAVHSDGEQVGVDATRVALQEPLRAIAVAGGTDSDALIGELLRADPNVGFNAVTRSTEDLAVAGVMDPTSVLIDALLVAESTARTFLETGSWNIRSDDAHWSAALDH
ncbi:MAG: chaperonin GroEL [Vicinamibacterales bacterium]